MAKTKEIEDEKPKTKYENPQIPSSYRYNDIGQTLYDFVLQEKPDLIIEFGTLHGYSAVAMGLALKKLGKGRLISYDLWDAYKFNHGTMSQVQDVVDSYGLSGIVQLENGDVNNWTPEPCDIIHLDISNDGEKLRKLAPKLKLSGAKVLFEGGIITRDQVNWMQKYNKQAMTTCGVKYDVIDSRFPGLSKLI